MDEGYVEDRQVRFDKPLSNYYKCVTTDKYTVLLNIRFLTLILIFEISER